MWSHRVRVRLSGPIITAGNLNHFWGFPQASYSGLSLCRTVETIGFECGIEPLGASNIGSGNGNKSCSHSAHVAVQACTPEKCSNSSWHTRTSSSSSLLIRTSSSSSLLIREKQYKPVSQTEWRQQAASAVCCGDINASYHISASLCGAQSAKRIS